MEADFLNAVASIYGDDSGKSGEVVADEDIDKSNPFFAKAYEKLPPLETAEDTTVKEVLEQ